MKRTVFSKGILIFCTLLFFASTNSIAQSTTITGTVYEKEQSKTTFNTPKGKITVYLPDDIASGDVISGTVIAKPNGKKEKQRKKNRKILNGYVLSLSSGVLLSSLDFSSSATNGQAPYETFSFTVPKDGTLPIEIRDADNKTVVSTELPTLPSVPTDETVTDQTQEFTLHKKVISNTEPVTITSSVAVSDVPMIVLSSYNNDVIYNSYDLESIIYSPRKMVYNLPPNLSGLYSVCLVNSDGTQQTIDLVNIVKIDASIGKGSLAKGETTDLKLKVSGLEDCPYEPVQLELVNQTPSIIQLAEGNVQIFPIDNSDNQDLMFSNESFETTQTVVGQTTGGFAIQSTVKIPPSAYANTVQPYFDDVYSTDEFNTSSDALKTDIDAFLTNSHPETNISEYLNRVKEYMQPVESNEDLNFAKSQVNNMLNRLNSIPEGKTFFNELSNLKNLHPEIMEQNAIPQSVHPLFNLAGEFNASTNVLRTNDVDKNALLKYLNATEVNNGFYNFTLNNGEQDVPFTNVFVEINESDALYNICGDHQPKAASGLGEGVGSKAAGALAGQPAQAKGIAGETKGIAGGNPLGAGAAVKGEKDTKTGLKNGLTEGVKSTIGESKEQGLADATKSETPPSKGSTSKSSAAKITSSFTDEEGIKYLFYKNAKCKLFLSARNTDKCREISEYFHDKETKQIVLRLTGKYEKTIFEDYKRCIVGEGFCTEMLQIQSTDMIYDDKECKRLVKVETRKEFNCQ